MEAYVTLKEFQSVLKDLRKLQGFLLHTFGNRFEEFQLDDVEIQKVNFNDKHGKVPTFSEDKTKEADCMIIETRSDKRDNLGMPVVLSSHSLLPTKISAPNNNTCMRDPDFGGNLPSQPHQPGSHDSIQTVGKPPNEPKKRTNIQRNPSPDEILAMQALPVTPRVPESLQGMKFFQNRPTSINVSNSDESSNEALFVPQIPIGIESMEGCPRPAKRPHAGRLTAATSIRNYNISVGTPTGATLETGIPSESGPAADRIVQCDQCKLFISSIELPIHVKNHELLESKKADKVFNPDSPQICPVCNVECDDFANYRQHLTDFHPLDEFPCPTCKRKFRSNSTLQRHMIVHQNLKFECSLCGKSYNRVDNLKAHYKTHTGENPSPVFYCPVCNNAFSSKQGRDKHVFSTHPAYNFSPSDHDQDSYGDERMNDNSLGLSAAPDPPEAIKVEGTLPTIDFEYEGDEDYT